MGLFKRSGKKPSSSARSGPSEATVQDCITDFAALIQKQMQSGSGGGASSMGVESMGDSLLMRQVHCSECGASITFGLMIKAADTGTGFDFVCPSCGHNEGMSLRFE